MLDGLLAAILSTDCHPKGHTRKTYGFVGRFHQKILQLLDVKRNLYDGFFFEIKTVDVQPLLFYDVADEAIDGMEATTTVART
mmetsp:Transcript_25301/g.37359  ORF Transcript_25301/g.37359 Transcript_25301/m.37359 type:complete len:83 (+) Transcript_25301:2424-2672(+)